MLSLQIANTFNHLSASTLGVIAIVVITVLIPISASALPVPVTPDEIAPSSQPPTSDHPHMSRKVIFDMVFALGLFVVAIGGFACVASSKTFSQFNAVIDRLCAASDTVQRHLSPFRLTAFFGRANDALAGTNNASFPSTMAGEVGLEVV